MRPYLAILTTIILFSTIEVAVKLIPQDAINHYFLAAIRFLVSGIIMLAMSWKKASLMTRRDFYWFLLVGGVGIGATFAPYHYVLEQTTKPEEVALIFSLNPIFASLTALFLLKESIKKNQIIALICGISGVYVVKFGFSAYNPASLKIAGLLLWTAVAFGFYTASAKKLVMKFGAIFTTGVVFIIGSIVLLLCTKGDITIAQPSQTVPVLLYLTLFTTLLGYLFYFYGLKRVPVATGAALFYLKPILATLFALVAPCIFSTYPEREYPEWNYYVGMGIIFLALTISIEPWRLYGKKEKK